ncbi:hypothetical protein ABIF97_004057 [Bradyrhizobium japonicum]
MGLCARRSAIWWHRSTVVDYRFEDSRSCECVERHLTGFSGILQVDGCAAYNRLVRSAGANEGATLAAYFTCQETVLRAAHQRELAQTVTTMAGCGRSRLTPRQGCRDAGESAPRSIRRYRRSAVRSVGEGAVPSRKPKLTEAIRYATSRRAARERFLSDGRIEIDCNTVEWAIRPQTIAIKDALFAGGHGGGRTWAAIATFFQTAKMNDVDPHAWLTQTPRMDRAGLAHLSDRSSHALALQSLKASAWRLRCIPFEGRFNRRNDDLAGHKCASSSFFCRGVLRRFALSEPVKHAACGSDADRKSFALGRNTHDVCSACDHTVRCAIGNDADLPDP